MAENHELLYAKANIEKLRLRTAFNSMDYNGLAPSIGARQSSTANNHSYKNSLDSNLSKTSSCDQEFPRKGSRCEIFGGFSSRSLHTKGESLISVSSGFKSLWMHTQGCKGCQKTRHFVRNSKILKARLTIQPKLSKIKKH